MEHSLSILSHVLLLIDQRHHLLISPLTPGLDLFRKRLEHRHEVQSKIVVGLLAAVEAERQGLGVDREVIMR